MPEDKKFIGVLQDPYTTCDELETTLKDFIAYAEQYGPVHVRQVDGWTVYSNCSITDEMIRNTRYNAKGD